MKYINEKRLLFLIFAAFIVITGCTTPAATDSPEIGREIERSTDTGTTIGSLTARSKDGPSTVEIDFSEYESNGGSTLEVHTVRVTVVSKESGRVVFEDRWRDAGWHGGRGNEEVPETVWVMSGLPAEVLEVELQIGSNRSASGERWLDSHLTFGPAVWDLSAGERTLILEPHPLTDTGSLTLEASNETGIGETNHPLGVFLSHQEGTAQYHFHLQPGREYLHYDGVAEGIRTGTYTVTIMARKDNDWPFYGNAVYERAINVTSGGDAYIAGELTENVAPWELGLTLSEFSLQNENTVYQTSFDASDPQMNGPHTYEQEQHRARFADGELIVAGPGDLSGGIDFDIPTGANSVVSVRARMPEDGQFFVNLRRWGESRMAVIFTAETDEEGPIIETFSTIEGKEVPGANSHAFVPELNVDQWYDYTLIDTGDKLLVFVDDRFTVLFSIWDELPNTGEIGLEWHRPCVFDSLSLATIDDVTVPSAVTVLR